MSATIHDAVRATLKALTAANGGTLQPGLQIRHGKDFGHEQPHIVRLVCHECGRTVQYWVLLENQLPELEGMVARAVQAHACWQPMSSAGCAGTEVTETPKPATRAAHFHEAAALLRAYPDYPGVMGLAAGLLELHAEDPHVYTSVLCSGGDHEGCAESTPMTYRNCAMCKAPCSCECHGEQR